MSTPQQWQHWFSGLSPERLSDLRETKRIRERARRASVAATRPPRPDRSPWKKAHRALHNARYEARKYGLDPGALTVEVFARLHLLPCSYCGVMPAMGADHVIPMVQGGPNAIENLTPACLSCNSKKGGVSDRPTRKLHAEEIREIRRLRGIGHTTVAIARQFSVSSQLVSRIATRGVWEHVA